MDILVPDSWLRDYLVTSATPKKIAEYLSLCGPSIDRINKVGSDTVYSIEVTTNRVDSASVYGIAREASAILPTFGVTAKLKTVKSNTKHKFVKRVKYLSATVDANLCSRFTAVLIKNVSIKASPNWMVDRLKLVGVRSINNVVDISNYIMHELGQPVHTFDYDKIKGAKMTLRQSRKGENLTTLDGKTHKLLGGDIVIEDGAGRLIDLAGIMGGENSAVDENTKNVLLFVQTYDPVRIRKTSMGLAARSEAAVLFEKGLDPELVSTAIIRGIELMSKLSGGKAENEILDIYPKPSKLKTLNIGYGFILKLLGIEISKEKITETLNSLGFGTSWKGETLNILVPSFRGRDIEIPEDIVEEIARIYGYHNLPSTLMSGLIPDPVESPFQFETNVKNILKGLGGVEVYTSSLVSKGLIEASSALKLKNPLGSEGEYLRVSLAPSLIEAVNLNTQEKDPFFFYEMANVYIPRSGNLPKEVVMLGVILKGMKYRQTKGVLTSLLDGLNVDYTFEQVDAGFFAASKRLSIKSGGKVIGQFGVLDNSDNVYFEIDTALLKNCVKPKTFIPIPKYPPQVEDLTFELPERTMIGNLIQDTLKLNSKISKMVLRDVFKSSFTFRVYYQDKEKTLTDAEVAEIRKKIISLVSSRFGGIPS